MSHFSLDGYLSYYNDSKINVCDGVVVYVLGTLDHNSTININDALKIIKITVKVNKLSLNISDLYRSRSIIKPKCNNLIENYLSQTSNLSNHFIIGDFNMNIMDNDFDNSIFLGHMLSYGYCPLINTITRPNPLNNNGSCIDNIFTKSNLSCKSIVHKQIFTDHFPIFAIIDLNTNFEKQKNVSHNFLNYKKFYSSALQINWDHIITYNNPSLALLELKNCINKCI